MRKADTWAAVTQLAEAQWGLLTAAQGERFGVSAISLSRLAGRGYLERETHGVYRLRGVAPSLLSALRAAWLHLEPARLVEERWQDLPDTGVVSHRSAARAQRLGDVLGEVHEFTAPVRRRSRRHDVRLHRGTLGTADVHLIEGLPVTTPWRTVHDLIADGEDGGHVASVLTDGVRSGVLTPLGVDPHALDPYAAGYRLQSGAELLRHLLELGGLTHAALEPAGTRRTFA